MGLAPKSNASWLRELGINKRGHDGMRSVARLVALCAALWLAASFGIGSAAAESQTLEYPLKATFLYRFADYIGWPPGALPDAGAPLTVCVVGDDPFGPALDQAMRGAQAAGHPVVAQRLAVASGHDLCQVMYLAGSARQSVSAALALVKGEPVLTVTDAARPDPARGIIHFVLHDNRVRFEIDEQAAAENGLTISSRLLSLALTVRQKEGAR